MSHVWAASLGARFGPGFVRRLQDSERPAVLAGLLLVLLLALTFFVGVGVLGLVVGTDRPTATAVVVGCFLLAAVGAVGITAETVTRWWWRGRRRGTAVLRPAPSGAPSTAVLRSRAALVTPWTYGLGLTAWGVVIATATDIPTWARAALVVLAVVVSSRLWALVLRRAVAGGVYLTAEALELRWGVATTTVPWRELETGHPRALVSRGEVPRTPGTTRRRSFPVQMATDVVDRPPSGVVDVPLTYLALPAGSVRAYVDLLVRSPHLREHLGTSRSLEWHVEPHPPGR